jgi:hypothetical protein
MPHAPQLALLALTSVHTSPQQVVPPGHITPPQRGDATQRPWSHVSPGLQVLPQAPQLVGLLVTSTHASPQQAEPGAHPRGQPGVFTHTPPSQVCAGEHARPQAPQLLRSKRGLTQPSRQHVVSAEQAGPPLQLALTTQRFDAHCRPGPQSLVVTHSTQRPVPTSQTGSVGSTRQSLLARHPPGTSTSGPSSRGTSTAGTSSLSPTSSERPQPPSDTMAAKAIQQASLFIACFLRETRSGWRTLRPFPAKHESTAGAPATQIPLL